jgi:hypothetical protein
MTKFQIDSWSDDQEMEMKKTKFDGKIRDNFLLQVMKKFLVVQFTSLLIIENLMFLEAKI